MGNNAGAGFMSGEGSTASAATEALRIKVEAHGGRIYCDDMNVCYTVDANGVRFRIHITKLATVNGARYYSATQGITL